MGGSNYNRGWSATAFPSKERQRVAGKRRKGKKKSHKRKRGCGTVAGEAQKKSSITLCSGASKTDRIRIDKRLKGVPVE